MLGPGVGRRQRHLVALLGDDLDRTPVAVLGYVERFDRRLREPGSGVAVDLEGAGGGSSATGVGGEVHGSAGDLHRLVLANDVDHFGVLADQELVLHGEGLFGGRHFHVRLSGNQCLRRRSARHLSRVRGVATATVEAYVLGHLGGTRQVAEVVAGHGGSARMPHQVNLVDAELRSDLVDESVHQVGVAFVVHARPS